MDLLSQPLQSIAILWETSIRNSELRNTVEQILQHRIMTNKLYSIEKLHQISVKGASTIYFIPTTPSYKLYGQYVTLINLDLTTEQLKNLIANRLQNPPIESYGLIKAKILNTIDDEKEDAQKLIVFNTNEILEIK
jgi:hypothetical protein